MTPLRGVRKRALREHIISLRLDDRELGLLVAAAKEMDLSASQVIRKALAAYTEPQIIAAPRPWWKRLFAA